MKDDLAKHKIVLPEPVLAFRLLNSANLPPEKIDLALATVKDLTYNSMAVTLGKIFSVQCSRNVQSELGDGFQVKTEIEECHFTYHNARGKSRGYGPIKGNKPGPNRGRGLPYSRPGPLSQNN